MPYGWGGCPPRCRFAVRGLRDGVEFVGSASRAVGGVGGEVGGQKGLAL